MLDGAKAFDLYATYGLPFEISRDIAREQDLDVDEAGFRAAMEEHSLASGGGKAMGKLGGEDAEFFAGILKDLQRKGRLGEKGVEYDPYTSPRAEGEVLALVVDGQAVQSACIRRCGGSHPATTGFYIESGGQVADEGIIRSLAVSNSGEPEWEIESPRYAPPVRGRDRAHRRSHQRASPRLAIRPSPKSICPAAMTSCATTPPRT